MRWEELEQQPCSLARTLSVVGDRWTLLVLRESFLGIRRFDEFEKRLGITRHVLADRLKKLVEAGVLDKVAYQQRPLREHFFFQYSKVLRVQFLLGLLRSLCGRCCGRKFSIFLAICAFWVCGCSF